MHRRLWPARPPPPHQTALPQRTVLALRVDQALEAAAHRVGARHRDAVDQVQLRLGVGAARGMVRFGLGGRGRKLAVDLCRTYGLRLRPPSV